MRRSAPLLAAALCLAALLGPPFVPALGQEEPAEPPKPLLTLESVSVEAAGAAGSLGPESLARLTVNLANAGEEIASSLVFTVSVAGHELPVYRNQVFLKPVPPGGTTELALYNFWTGETGRPAPADGKLRVEVTLREAQWMEVSEEEGTEVWTPLGEVEGLPSTAATEVKLAKGS